MLLCQVTSMQEHRILEFRLRASAAITIMNVCSEGSLLASGTRKQISLHDSCLVITLRYEGLVPSHSIQQHMLLANVSSPVPLAMKDSARDTQLTSLA